MTSPTGNIYSPNEDRDDVDGSSTEVIQNGTGAFEWIFENEKNDNFLLMEEALFSGNFWKTRFT